MLNVHKKNILHLILSKCEMWTIRIIIAHIFISPIITMTKPRNPKIYQVDLYYPDLLQTNCVTLGYSTLIFCLLNSTVKFWSKYSLWACWHFPVKSSNTRECQTPEKSMQEIRYAYMLVHPMTFSVLSGCNLPLAIQESSLPCFPSLVP